MLDKCAALTDAGLSALGEHLPTGALGCTDGDTVGFGGLVGVVGGR